MKAGIIVVAVFVLLFALYLFMICAPMFLDDAEVSRAKMDVKTLEKALLQYHSAHGAWPKNLAVLAAPQEDGSPAYVDPGHLIDPWGRPYLFGPGQRHPITNHPLVWSEGRYPGSTSGKIANWSPPD